MDISEELIKRFFLRSCTQSEANEVAEYLKSRADIQEKFLQQSDWDATENRIDEVPEHLTFEMWTEIRKETRPTPLISFRRMAIAASFIGLCGLLYFAIYNASTKTENKNISQKSANAILNVEPEIYSNTSDSTIQLNLSDGSIIKLEGKSEISYEIDTKLRERKIRLNGSAFFKVAKDQTRPFIVYSGNISTTALGTQFFVANKKGDDAMSVALYEGKVVVKTNPSFPTKTRNYFLIPGKKLVYNRRSLLVNIIDFTSGSIASKPSSKISISSTIFNNENLSATLEQLSKMYNVRIDYSSQDLKGRSFIGGINKSDSIENILKDICLLNNLSLSKKGKVYIINKRK